MASEERSTNLSLLLNVAVRSIVGAFTAGDAVHGNKWVSVPPEQHLERAIDHLRFQWGVITGDPLPRVPEYTDQDHLAHAICRVAMAIVLTREQKK